MIEENCDGRLQDGGALALPPSAPEIPRAALSSNGSRSSRQQGVLYTNALPFVRFAPAREIVAATGCLATT